MFLKRADWKNPVCEKVDNSNEAVLKSRLYALVAYSRSWKKINREDARQGRIFTREKQQQQQQKKKVFHYSEMWKFGRVTPDRNALLFQELIFFVSLFFESVDVWYSTGGEKN